MMKSVAAVWFSAVVFLHAGKLDFPMMEKEINAPADARLVTADFEFTNRSGKPVVISHYEATCSCMTVQLKGAKTRYEPGESGVVRATFDMGNFSGDTDKTVVLWLDGDRKSGEPTVKLTTLVHIPVLVSLLPKTVTWDMGEKPSAKVIRITMNHTKPIKVLEISSGSKNFRHELKTLKEGKSYELSVTPLETDKPAIGILVIETDCDISKHRMQQCFASVRKAPGLLKQGKGK